MIVKWSFCKVKILAAPICKLVAGKSHSCNYNSANYQVIMAISENIVKLENVQHSGMFSCCFYLEPPCLERPQYRFSSHCHSSGKH